MKICVYLSGAVLIHSRKPFDILMFKLIIDSTDAIAKRQLECIGLLKPKFLNTTMTDYTTIR